MLFETKDPRIILVNRHRIIVYRHTIMNQDKINWEELKTGLSAIWNFLAKIVILRVVRERCNFVIKEK